MLKNMLHMHRMGLVLRLFKILRGWPDLARIPLIDNAWATCFSNALLQSRKSAAIYTDCDTLVAGRGCNGGPRTAVNLLFTATRGQESTGPVQML